MFIFTRYCTAELEFKYLQTYLIRLSAWEFPLSLCFSAADPLAVGMNAFLSGDRVDVVHWTGILVMHKHFDIRGVCEIQM